MPNYIHTKIAEIGDADFQQMIEELYHCVGWERDDSSVPTVFQLLQIIGVEDPKSLSLNHLPYKGILATKVDKVKRGAVYDFCVELTNFGHNHIECFDNKTVLSLIKKCFPWVKNPRSKKPSRNQLLHEQTTRIIEQRRRNGDL